MLLGKLFFRFSSSSSRSARPPISFKYSEIIENTKQRGQIWQPESRKFLEDGPRRASTSQIGNEGETYQVIKAPLDDPYKHQEQKVNEQNEQLPIKPRKKRGKNSQDWANRTGGYWRSENHGEDKLNTEIYAKRTKYREELTRADKGHTPTRDQDFEPRSHYTEDKRLEKHKIHQSRYLNNNLKVNSYEGRRRALAPKDFDIVDLPDENAEKVYGIHPVLLALQAEKRDIYKIYCKTNLENTNGMINQIYNIAQERNIEFESLDGKIIRKQFAKDTVHQNIFCVASEIPINNISSGNLESFLREVSTLKRLNTARNDESLNKREEEQWHTISKKMATSAIRTDKTEEAEEQRVSSHLIDIKGTERFIAAEPVDGDYVAPLVCATVDEDNAVPLDGVPVDGGNTVTLDSTTLDSVGALPSNSAPVERLHAVSLDGAPVTLDSTPVASVGAVPSNSAPVERLPAVSLDGAPVDRVGVVPSDDAAISPSDITATTSHQVWVMVDRVVDPMNMGALLRSCCYFGVARVLLTASCAAISPVVSKASSGAAELMPITRLAHPVSVLSAMKERGWQLVTSVTAGGSAVTVNQLSLSGNMLLVIGNEAHGICPLITALSDVSVSIPGVGPLSGSVGCLNVSVATAVLLHSLTNSSSSSSSSGSNNNSRGGCDKPHM